MNTRRIPFQFSSTDPLVRQKELEKRFGLQPTCQKMYVDVKNPLSMDSKEASSPRLQHRVPIFAEGYNRPMYSSSVDSMASVPDKKPNVRVIPIEIEGADSRSPRHRNYSGPACMVKDHSGDAVPERNGASPFKKFHFDDSSKSQGPKFNAEPKIYNIPIKVEGANDVSNSPRFNTMPNLKSATSRANGCSQSKSSSSSNAKPFVKEIKVQSEPRQSQVDKPKSNVEILLGKIEDVLAEFKTYENGVVEFTGTTKDKQYRYLDEMLTRCMLRLDDIDTMGNEEVRLARKSAVKKIQASIDLLESKANAETSTAEVQSTPVENSIEDTNDSVVEMQENQEKVYSVDLVENETSEVKEMDLTTDDEHVSGTLKTSDEIISNDSNKSESNVESTEMTLLPQNIIEDAVEVLVMSEDEASKLTEITDKPEDVVQDEDNSSKLQNDSATEIEMSEEVSSAEVNSTNSAPLPDTSSNDESKLKSEVCDIDMLDEKIVSNADEKSPTNIVQEDMESKSTEVPEVEMAEIGDNSSKDLGEKIECETNEKTDCSVQETSLATVLPDTEMKDAVDIAEKLMTSL